MTTGLVLIGVTGDAVVAGEDDRSGLSCSCPLNSGDGGGLDRPSDGAIFAAVTRLVDSLSTRGALVSGVGRGVETGSSGSGGGGASGDLGGIVGGDDGGRICS